MSQCYQRRIIEHLIGAHTESSQTQQLTNQLQNCHFPKTIYSHQYNNSLVIKHQKNLYQLQDSQDSSISASLSNNLQSSQNKSKAKGDLYKLAQQTNSLVDKSSSNCKNNQIEDTQLNCFQFEICVDIGDGRIGSIIVNQSTDSYQVAKIFCSTHQLQQYVVPILAQSIFQQKQAQKSAISNIVEQNKVLIKNQYTEESEELQNKQQIIEQMSTQCRSKATLGADRILQKRRKSSAGRSRCNEYANLQENISRPSINEISQEIINKMGKENIIQRKLSKSQQKISRILEKARQQSQKQMKQCLFNPKINDISRRVSTIVYNADEKPRINCKTAILLNGTKVQQISQLQSNKNGQYQSKGKPQRYQQLYENWKVIEKKKEQSRKNSLEQIRFKPQINDISRKIVQKIHQTSKVESRVQWREFEENSHMYESRQWQKPNRHRNKNSRVSNHRYYQSHRNSCQDIVLKNSRSSMNLRQDKHLTKSRNIKNLPVGEYLYEEAKRIQRKKQKSREELNAPQPTILGRSNELIITIRQKRLREIFQSLRKGEVLRYSDLDWQSMTELQLLFEPVFRQMDDIGVDLTQEEFVKAGQRLIKYIPQDKKALFLVKAEHSNYKVPLHELQINGKSEQLVQENCMYKQHDIYTRGQIHKISVKNQIEKGKEERVRSQLRQCTFRPQINKKFVASDM